MKSILHIVGARPQFVKLAPVLSACHKLELPCKVIHTGQHYDANMSDLHFKVLELPQPDFNLAIGSGSHGQQTGQMLAAIENILISEAPGGVVVYGDTNSTLAGALAAAKLHIPVAHVEAGLRSFDRKMPEEINRVTTDHLACQHFCPTAHAVELLKREGIEGLFTGDVMYDALLSLKAHAPRPSIDKPYILATIHRAENTDQPERFQAIWQALCELSQETSVIFPVHPRTRPLIANLGLKTPSGLELCEPVSYLEMLGLIEKAELMLTDSGGVQKEALLLETPCVTVRATTEWPETIQARANVLAAAEPQAILKACAQMRAAQIDTSLKPYGDGRASAVIAKKLKEF